MSSEDFTAAFVEFINCHKLLHPDQKVLVAISGGVDSVVLAHLLHQTGYALGLAHCNFKLRAAADEDENFVENLAEKLQVPFYNTSFDTSAYAEKHGISTQMAARQLRYQWLEQIRSEHGYQRIAVAHHLNDQAETLLLNLAKGTGISGLRGMLPKRDAIIRPLLFASKEQIENFARAENISYREDESNQSTKYQRNLVRLEMMPLLEKLNPSFLEGLPRTLDNLAYAEQLYRERLATYQNRLLDQRKDAIYIPLRRLRAYPYPVQMLYDILKEYGFHFEQIQTAVSLGLNESGQTFDSRKWRLLKNRHLLILSPLEEKEAGRIYITPKPQTIQFNGGKIKMELQEQPAPLSIPSKTTEAWVDADQLEFPLVLRPWKKGDYMYPLGMTKPHADKVGKKKLSDLFTDLKLSNLQKENTWVLQSGKKIVWVVGLRLDDRFKITDATKGIAVFKWIATES